MATAMITAMPGAMASSVSREPGSVAKTVAGTSASRPIAIKGGPNGPPFHIDRDRSLGVLRMPQNKLKSTGPTTMQPLERGAIMPTEGLPMMPAVGKPAKTPQPIRQPTRTEAVRAAQARTMRRNSLRKQRDAQRATISPRVKTQLPMLRLNGLVNRIWGANRCGRTCFGLATGNGRGLSRLFQAIAVA